MLLVSGAISSAGEHYIDIVGVTGSIPVSPTTVHSFMTYDVTKSVNTLGGDKGCFIYCAQPPLNGIACPTKKSLSFEAKNTANIASSSAVARRPAGTPFNNS